MFNQKLIEFLRQQLTSAQEELRKVRENYEQKFEQLRRECDEKIAQERNRCDTEIRLSRVREQGLIDRFLLKNGVPQIYDSVESEPESPSNIDLSLPPGLRSIQHYKNLEDQLWQTTPDALLQEQVIQAKQNILSELIDE